MPANELSAILIVNMQSVFELGIKMYSSWVINLRKQLENNIPRKNEAELREKLKVAEEKLKAYRQGIPYYLYAKPE